MRLDLLNVDNVVRKNKLRKVERQILMDSSGEPDPDGLYSYEIFGRLGSPDRKLRFAYIDLGGKFMHPMVYGVIRTMSRGIGGLFQRSTWWRINPKGGWLEQSEEGAPGAGTGLPWLYANWDSIRWKSTGTKAREARIRLLSKLTRKEVFIDKWLVIPPFYRDMDRRGGRLAMDDITGMYKRLITLGQGRTAGDSFVSGMVDWRTQSVLNELYDMLVNRLAKKRGTIKRDVLSKNIDYAVRSVISECKLDTNTHRDLQVPYGWIGVPLHMALVLFFPFAAHQMEAMLAEFKSDTLVVTGFHPGAKKRYELLRKTVAGLTSASFERLVNLFGRSHDHRLAPMEILTEQGKRDLDFGALNLGRPFLAAGLPVPRRHAGGPGQARVRLPLSGGGLPQHRPHEDPRAHHGGHRGDGAGGRNEDPPLSQAGSEESRKDQVGGQRQAQQRLSAGVRRRLRRGHGEPAGSVHARGEHRGGGHRQEAADAAGPLRQALPGVLQGGSAVAVQLHPGLNRPLAGISWAYYSFDPQRCCGYDSRDGGWGHVQDHFAG